MLNKNIFILILTLSYLYGCGSSQINLEEEANILRAIEEQALEIKDTDPNTQLKNTETMDRIFKTIRVFGFGEATHGTKEFANIKAKFFKYLVENQGVKNLAMEVSYGNTVAIDDYIKGKEGNARKLTAQTGMWISNTKEVLELIEWMRSHNSGKPESEQLSFYGIDLQDATNSAKLMLAYLDHHPIPNQDEYAKIIDQYTTRKKSTQLKSSTLKEHLSKMSELEKELNNAGFADDNGYVAVQRSLIQFINFSLNHNQKTRDKAMAENVRHILQASDKNAKVFVWTHNFHVEKDKITSTNTPSMGHYLKDWYGNKYYSLGFEFALGTFNAYNLNDKEIKEVSIPEPLENTRGALFTNSILENFFLDFNSVDKIGALMDYLNTKTSYRVIGSVYNPKMVASKKLISAYDGIIFIKESGPTTTLK